jgi:hypothetical protein
MRALRVEMAFIVPPLKGGSAARHEGLLKYDAMSTYPALSGPELTVDIAHIVCL